MLPTIADGRLMLNTTPDADQAKRNWALKKAGIKKRVRLYDLRHMYGTLMAKNKADIFALQKLMGHADIQTTKNYLHHAEDLKEDAVNNCLPGLDS
jgi:integrase